MDRKFILVNVTNKDRTWPLGLSLRSQAECDRAINWQNVGQSSDDVWATLLPSEVSLLLSQGRMDRGPYTQEAWDRFLVVLSHC